MSDPVLSENLANPSEITEQQKKLTVIALLTVFLLSALDHL